MVVEGVDGMVLVVSLDVGIVWFGVVWGILVLVWRCAGFKGYIADVLLVERKCYLFAC